MPTLQRSYHVLQCFAVPFTRVLELGAIPRVKGVDSWMSGARITAPVPAPLTIEIDPDEPGDLRELYQLEALIMSDRLVNALIEAGVDNLQVYDLRIVGPETGRELRTHRIVNVVGIVACADLDRSTWQSPRGEPMIDVDFESLAIDEARAGGHLLFRLAECVTAVIVHERVREHLVARGFTMLTFQDPADFVG